ncbi:hypothetical protein KAT36_04335 [Candidatus Pacearchaeota archaeon]|nr:hypothetical protein [Candidatus Pacearchaeota archaeon]
MGKKDANGNLRKLECVKNLKFSKKKLQPGNKFKELETRQRYNIGIISGITSGFFVIIMMNLYENIFSSTKDNVLALLAVIVIVSAIIYIGIVRPTGICVKELESYEK